MIGWSSRYGPLERGDPDLHHAAGSVYAEGMFWLVLGFDDLDFLINQNWEFHRQRTVRRREASYFRDIGVGGNIGQTRV